MPGSKRLDEREQWRQEEREFAKIGRVHRKSDKEVS